MEYCYSRLVRSNPIVTALTISNHNHQGYDFKLYPFLFATTKARQRNAEFVSVIIRILEFFYTKYIVYTRKG